MRDTDLYAVLEVHREASLEVIRAAYKTLCAKYHPDRDSSPSAVAKFAAVQQAFEVLSDSVRRREYDNNPNATGTDSPGARVVNRVDGSCTFLTLAEHMRRRWQESERCDLSNFDFSGISFKDAKLSGAKLDGGRFSGCDFRGADLTGVSARHCNFDSVDFAGAIIVSADFSRSRIVAAKFYSIGRVAKSSNTNAAERFHRYSDSTLTYLQTTEDVESVTEIRETDFTDSDLSGCRFSEECHTKESVVNSSTMLGIQQSHRFWLRQLILSSKVSKCVFTRANLTGCRLSGLDLRTWSFQDAVLRQANITNCDICAVDLSTVVLLDANFADCTYSESTVFPPGFTVPQNTRNSDQKLRAETKTEGADVFLTVGLAVALTVLLFMVILAATR